MGFINITLFLNISNIFYMSLQNGISSVISSLQNKLNIINGDTTAIGTDAGRTNQGLNSIAIHKKVDLFII